MRHIVLLSLLLASPLYAETPAAPPVGDALTASIRAADGAMFGLVFDGCDPAKLRTMVTDDMEFYHDKGGQTASSGDAFVADYAKSCEAKKAPDAWRSRRELVVESLHVDPVPGFGAMEVGEHLFFERKGDGPEKLVGRAGFAMVWKWVDGSWKLHRVLSFGHKPVQ
jgi:Domain of unknown function (DUF4440)